MTIGMRWEAIGAIGGLFPVLDGDISLNPDQGQFTRLKLTGCYRPPLGALGASLDRMLMHMVAELTLRSVVTSLALSLEGASPVAGPNVGCVAAEDWTADRARLSAPAPGWCAGRAGVHGGQVGPGPGQDVQPVGGVPGVRRDVAAGA